MHLPRQSLHLFSFTERLHLFLILFVATAEKICSKNQKGQYSSILHRVHKPNFPEYQANSSPLSSSPSANFRSALIALLKMNFAKSGNPALFISLSKKSTTRWAPSSTSSRTLFVRPGKCAFAVAKQRTGNQFFRYGAAVEFLKLIGFARAFVVNRFRNQFLSRAGFAGD